MDEQRPPEEDPGANTEMFRAFVAGDERQQPARASGSTFRIVTLLVGLGVFVAVVVLLVKL